MRKVFSFIARHKIIFSTFGVILLLLIGLGVYAGIGYGRIRGDIRLIQADLSTLQADQTTHSVTKATSDLTKLENDLKNIQNDKDYFFPLKYIPILNNYYANVGYIIDGGKTLSSAFIDVIKSSTSLANALGYGPQTAVGQDKVGLLINSLPTISDALVSKMDQLKQAQDDFNAVNLNYFPSVSYKGTNIKNTFISYVNEYNNFIGLLPKLTSISPVLQTAFGDPTSKNYLLILQNDNELRPSGGFLTAYGYLNFNKGNLAKIVTNNIYYLDDNDKPNLTAPAQIQQYILDDTTSKTWFLRDANYSPDVPTSAKVIEADYRTIPSSKVPPIDGVVLVNTQLITAILNVIGPVYVPTYKQTVTASDVSYLMEYYAEKVDNNSTNSNTKKFLNYLMEDIEAKIFNTSKGDFINFLQLAFDQTQKRNVQLYADDASVENLINEYNMGGSFPKPTTGDFLGVVDANMLSGKSDLYISRSIKQTVTKTPKGLLENVSVTYTNDHVGDGWLNHNTKTWFKLYVPLGSTVVSMSGDDQYYHGATRRYYDQFGYSVIDTHLTVPMKDASTGVNGRVTLSISYYLPSTISENGPYSLNVFKQSGVSNLQLTSTVLGKTKKANIVQDTTINF